MKYRFKLTKLDCIFLLIIIIIIGLLFIFVNNSNEGQNVKITQDSKVIYDESINNNKKIKLYNDNNILCNEIIINNRHVSMNYANCKNQTCVNQNSISKENESIVCIPNNVIIEITGDNDKIDGISK